jgi:PAS domain S-box-containing protein
VSLGVAIPLLACIAAVLIAIGILAADSGQRANRLVALVLACSAHWSMCEVLWNLADDPEVVIWLVRLSAAGWLWLAPLSLELYVEILGDARSPLRRLIPVAYATAALSLVLYITPWCVHEPIRTSWGWGYSFGPLFWVAYLPTMLWVGLVLIQWPGFFSRSGSSGERGQALWMFFGIGTPMTMASVTDVFLPMLGLHVPRLGSASVVVVGAVVAWSIRRYGYFLMAPGAFTYEILETLRDGVALVQPGGAIRACNGALARLVGASPQALEGSSIRDWIPDLELSLDPNDSETELELTPVETGAAVPVSISSTLLHGDRGRFAGYVLVLRDLREVESLRSRLARSDRLAAVGELAAGIAHEINNPITFVRSNLIELGHLWHTLEDEAEKTDRADFLSPLLGEGVELLEESVEGVDRIATVTRGVGEISHAGLDTSEWADIHELLENAIGVAALSYTVVVGRRFGELPRVRCNPQQLKQVFLNLLLNAFQAIGDFGQIMLVTWGTPSQVVIEVRDDGCGIPSEAIDRIFDPFFTTRPAGTGTGLGLALSYQIVRNHGGEISVASSPGRGSTFTVELPVEAPQRDATREDGEPATAGD